MDTAAVSNEEPTEAEILHPSDEVTVQWEGKPTTLKRLSMGDTIDLMQDMMKMVSAAGENFPGQDINSLDNDKMSLMMLSQMKTMFKVPARLAGLTEQEFLDGDPDEASTLFKTVMASADVMKVFSNLSEGWSKMSLQAPATETLEQSPSS